MSIKTGSIVNVPSGANLSYSDVIKTVPSNSKTLSYQDEVKKVPSGGSDLSYSDSVKKVPDNTNNNF